MDVTSQAAASSSGAAIGISITHLDHTNTNTRTRRGVFRSFGTSEWSRGNVRANALEDTSNSGLLAAHGENTVSGTVNSENNINSVAAVETLIQALAIEPETLSESGSCAVASVGVVGAGAFVAASGVVVPRAGAVGIARGLSGVLTARTRTATWRTDIIIPEASGSLGADNLGLNPTTGRAGLTSGVGSDPNADGVVLARNLRGLRRVTAAEFTTFVAGLADIVGFIPSTLPG